jgi:hypothetical protein
VSAATTPAPTRTVTTNTSQTSASSDERFGVNCPPNERSTLLVRKLAATVGTPTKKIPCQASSSR